MDLHPIAPKCRREVVISGMSSPILLETVAAGGGEPSPGGGNGWRLGLPETHVQPHPAIGDVVMWRRARCGSSSAGRTGSISGRPQSPAARPFPGPRRRWIPDFARAARFLRRKS